MRHFSILVLFGFVTLSFVFFDAFADSNPDNDYLKFPLDGFYIYADNQHVTQVELDWADKLLPHGTIYLDEKIDSEIRLVIPKNVPRTMNLDFGSSMAVFYSDALIIPIKETKSDCFYHLRIPVNNIDEINIDSISVATGRWEPVTIDDPNCYDAYRHYSDTYKSKLVQSQKSYVVLSPLKQIKQGIALANVQCDDQRHVIYKHDRMRAACVTSSTYGDLIDRGWAALRLETSATSDVGQNLCVWYGGDWDRWSRHCNELESQLCVLWQKEIS